MNIKPLLLTIFLSVCLHCKFSGQNSKSPVSRKQNSKLKYELTPVLGKPFGTIIDLQVQVVDGDSLYYNSVETRNHFLLRIIKIEGKIIKNGPILHFEDRSGYLPEDLENLYWHVYDHQPKTGITHDTAVILTRDYIGKIFNIAAYESGFFWGMPDNYTDYTWIVSEPSFHFRSTLVVVADLNKPKRER